MSTTILHLDSGALEVVATLCDDPVSVVRLAATCRELRRVLMENENGVGWRKAATFLGATDTAGVPWLPRGEATAERPLPRALSHRAAALAFGEAVRDTHGAAVARALSKLRSALHAVSPPLAATLCQGADEEAMAFTRTLGWGSAALTYATLCNGQTAGVTPAFDPFIELTGSLWGGCVYEDMLLGRLLAFAPLQRGGGGDDDDDEAPWLAGNPEAIMYMLHSGGRGLPRIEGDRVLVVDARAPGAPVHQTLVRRISTRRRAARAHDPARARAAPSLAAWLAAFADEVAARRRVVVEGRPPWLRTIAAPVWRAVPPGRPPSLDAFPVGETAVTRGLRVSVAVLPTYMNTFAGDGDDDDLSNDAVVFSYKIRLVLPSPTDQGVTPLTDALARVRLTTRRWETTDARGCLLEPPVRGPGVLGEHPALVAGEGEDSRFSYCSRTMHPASRVPGAGLPRDAPADSFLGTFAFEGETVGGRRSSLWLWCRR